MYIDDVKVVSNSTPGEYENYMDSYIYQEVNLTKYDMVNLSYNYWLDSEVGFDSLYVIYNLGSSWYFIDGRSGNSGGWASSYAQIPTGATSVGFHFYSEGNDGYYWNREVAPAHHYHDLKLDTRMFEQRLASYQGDLQLGKDMLRPDHSGRSIQIRVMGKVAAQLIDLGMQPRRYSRLSN